MNILPFITVFLLVFALLSSSFFVNVKELLTEKKAYTTYMAELRLARDKKQIDLYEKTKRRHRKKPNPAKQKKEMPYISPRTRVKNRPASKLNLYRLLSEPKPSKTLQKSFSKLLSNLYGDKLSEQELTLLQKTLTKRGHHLLEKAMKKGNEITEFSLTDLLDVSNPTHYKILRGTHKYTLTEGIVPLETFVFFEKGPSPLQINLASPELLQLLFGQEKAKKILAKEKKEKRGLKLQEFQAIVSDQYFSAKWIQTSTKQRKAVSGAKS